MVSGALVWPQREEALMLSACCSSAELINLSPTNLLIAFRMVERMSSTENAGATMSDNKIKLSNDSLQWSSAVF